MDHICATSRPRGCDWGSSHGHDEWSKRSGVQQNADLHDMLLNTAQGISTLCIMVKQGTEDTQMSILQLKQNLSELQHSFEASAIAGLAFPELLKAPGVPRVAQIADGEVNGKSGTSPAPQATTIQELDVRMQSVMASVEILAKEMRDDRKIQGMGPETKLSETPIKSNNQGQFETLHDELEAFQKSLVAEMHMQSVGLLEHEGRMVALLDSKVSDFCIPVARPQSVQLEFPSMEKSRVEEAPNESQPEGGLDKSVAGQFIECDIGEKKQALSEVVVAADDIPVTEAQQATLECADQDAHELNAIEEQTRNAIEEHAFDENAHLTIQLKESSGLASVFCNDDDVERPPYDVADFYYKTGCCQAVARSDLFQNFTVFVVILNALYIGIDADWNRSENIFDAHWFFMVSSNAFCVYFTGELVVRFLAFEKKRKAWKDGWFKFDTFLVVTMILDTWIIMSIMKVQGGEVAIPVQPLRMLRLFKLTRMARLMKAFPELVTMIKGLIRSLRAISSSGILVGLMVYTWAILLHMLLKNEVELNEGLYNDSMMNFETITNCMWILIVDGTLMLDNAGPLMTGLLFADKINLILAGIAFSLYALLSALLILQMLIGVLCDVVARVGQEQRDAAAIGLVKQELLALISQFNDGDGKISQKNLMKVMKHPKAAAVLKKLNINHIFLMELQKMMFPKPDSTVPIRAILELMIMCRGDNMATVEALSGGFCFLEGVMLEIKDQLDNVMQEQAETTHKKLDNHHSLLDNHINETKARISSYSPI